MAKDDNDADAVRRVRYARLPRWNAYKGPPGWLAYTHLSAAWGPTKDEAHNNLLKVIDPLELIGF